MKKLGCAKKFLKFIFLSPSSLPSLSLHLFLLFFSSIPFFLSFFPPSLLPLGISFHLEMMDSDTLPALEQFQSEEVAM